MMSGANIAAVQRILRHKDPRLTTEVCGHLAPGYLRNEVDRLSFGLGSKEKESAMREGEVAAQIVNGESFAANMLLASTNPPGEANGTAEIAKQNQLFKSMRPEGFEPPTFGFVVRRSIQLS